MTYRSARQILVTAFGAQVFGMDLTTGARVWEFHWGGTGNVRLAIEELVVVGLSTRGGGLYCLNYETGEKLWHDRRVDGDTLLVVADRVLVGCRGELACYSLADGAKLWEDKFKGMGTCELSIGVPGRVAQADSNT
jgi:outer membrane protein assembly factor BamB